MHACGSGSTSSERAPGWAILCDFDGTIGVEDVTDTLLEHFGQPGWQDAEQRWLRGEIGSAQCLSEQIALLDMSRSQLEACLGRISIDAGFAGFVRQAQASAIPLAIVSDGLDMAIHHILQRHRLPPLPVFANRLVQTGERRWRIDFPHRHPQCLQASGNCKCQFAQRLAPQRVLAIGDGLSDFCVAARADHVFARARLIGECRRASLPFTPFERFHQLSTALTRLQAQDAHQPTRRHHDRKA